MLGISTKEPYVHLKCIGNLYSHLRKQVIIFKPSIVDEVFVQAQYLEDIGNKKGKPSGSK